MRACQQAVDSVEFAEWLMFYELEAEMTGLIQREPTPGELGSKLAAWATAHNAKEHGKVKQERR